MPRGVNIDGVLVTWGDRLFYPGNRAVKGVTPPKLTGSALRQRANFIRNRIEAIVRRAPQVMVKVTGGGRCMRAIAAHFRYISKNGRLNIEDDRGEIIKGHHAVRDLADDWRFSGSRIPEDADGSGRREAFNIMLSMPRGMDPLAVQRAARQFARVELAGHKYVMVLHDHQANPHVHLSVRAEGSDGRRLNPRKADLYRWRETFAEGLRELGVNAEATRRTTRGRRYPFDPIWRLKATAEGRLRVQAIDRKSAVRAPTTSADILESWSRIAEALSSSGDLADVKLAREVAGFMSQIAGQLAWGDQERGPEMQPSPSIVARER